jgi:ribosomal protein S18 acetylase RimI-like enzyme
VTGGPPLRIDVARSLDEVRLILDWAAAEGWNPGLRDAEAFLAADPEGFLLGRLHGEPAAAISLVRYDDRFAFLGCYIVRPELRGHGHGMAIWRAAIERAGGRTIGLDGVPAQQPNYRRSGFELERRNLRYSGVVRDGWAPITEPRLLDMVHVPADELSAYDRSVFGADRPGFVERWLTLPGHAAVAWRDADDVVRGYGVARPCRSGWKIGPLFADTDAIADALWRWLLAQIGGDRVSFDVPETNAAAVGMAERAGLVVDFETARMYAGRPPNEDRHRVYGVTTFELG